MVEVGPASPAVSTLDVFEHIAYASTSTETMQVIGFFLEALQPIQAEDLDPDERKCHICSDDFRAGSHVAVRLPCNHHFGEQCIQNWLRPYENPTKTKDEWKCGANSCPLCRQVFFPEQRNCDILPEMEMRIKLWDKVFAHVGIALSEQERQAREDLLLFIQKYHSRGFDVYYPSRSEAPFPYLLWAQIELFIFSRRLTKNKTLNPVQKHLAQKLLKIARPMAGGEFRWREDNVGELFMEMEPEDDK